MHECSERSERPVSSCNFEMLGEIFTDRIKILAIIKSKKILDVFLSTKFDGLTFHIDIIKL